MANTAPPPDIGSSGKIDRTGDQEIPLEPVSEAATKAGADAGTDAGSGPADPSDTTDAATETLGDVMSQYQLSSVVRDIVNAAIPFAHASGDAQLMSAGALFRALLAVGGQRPPPSSALELHNFVRERSDGKAFEAAISPPSTGGFSPADIQMTRRGLDVFQAAKIIAGRASGQEVVSTRHFVAAFVAPVPDSDLAALTQRSWQRTLAVDFGQFRPVLLAYLERSHADSDRENFAVWRQLLAQRDRRTLPGFSPDSGALPTDDALGITPDVEAFAELICLREASPPLSIGLFGNWGSGKTTFMDRLASEIDALTGRVRLENRRQAADAGDPGTPSPYVTDIVQIKFNAWHYADGDIWASLTAEFFDQLRAGGFAHAVDARYAHLVDEVARKARDADAAATSAQEELDSLRSEIDQTTRELREARQKLTAASLGVFADHASKLLDKTLEQQKGAIDAAGKAVGIDDLSEKPTAFRDSVRDASTTLGHLKLIRKAIFSSKWRAILLLIGIVLLAGLAAVVASGNFAAWWASAGTILIGLMALAAPILTALKAIQPIVRIGAAFAKALDDDTKELDQEVAAKEKRLGELEERARKQTAAVDEARGRAERYITDSDDAHRSLLRHFLFESAETRQYEDKLGIISRARKSFERLNAIVLRLRELREARERRQPAQRAALLEGGRRREAACSHCGQKVVVELRTIDQCSNCGSIFEKNGDPIGDEEARTTGKMPEIDRIVLYIDDLDRCRHQQVVKVLEAVHLLLAFDLFIVVVGVDARWMRNALAAYYEGELGPGTDDGDVDNAKDSRHAATPDDYLEKIFQIPFWLQPLSTDKDGTYQKLIDSLTRTDQAEDAARSPPPSGKARPEATATAGGAPDAGQASAGGDEKPPPDGGETDAEAATRPLQIERVRLTTGEIALLKRVGALTGTSPRTAKRFLNLYRLVRARRTGDSLSRFLGEDGEPPEYPTVVFLLALATGLEGHEMRRLLATVPTKASKAAWTAWASSLENEAAEAFINQAVQDKAFDLQGSGAVTRLAPMVSRYSFLHLA